MTEEQVQQIIAGFIEVSIESDDDFLIIRETLRRMGIANKQEKIIYQSCNILYKRGKYYICHFKQLMALDGRKTTLDDIDLGRTKKIATMLSDWGLVKILHTPDNIKEVADQFVFVLTSKWAQEWQLIEKYKIGRK
jgi:hypothetical protein